MHEGFWYTEDSFLSKYFIFWDMQFSVANDTNMRFKIKSVLFGSLGDSKNKHTYYTATKETSFHWPLGLTGDCVW